MPKIDAAHLILDQISGLRQALGRPTATQRAR
jgi:hypothetical protein